MSEALRANGTKLRPGILHVLRFNHMRPTKQVFFLDQERQQRCLFEVQEYDLNYSKQSQLSYVAFTLRS